MSVIFAIQPGVITTMLSSVAYALPNRRCLLFATTGTFQISNDSTFTTSSAVTVDTNNQVELAAGFIRCTTGDIVVIVKTF